MLPIYKAISFQGVLQGGHTKPFVVLVSKNGRPVPFVVKLFTFEQNEQEESVVNEVIGSIIASNFDLPVPFPALIDLSKDFIDTIDDVEIVNRLKQLDKRVTFGCEYMESYMKFIPTQRFIKKIRKIIDIDTVFAFDTLIVNSDRGDNKSNILIRGDSVFLIDHEKAFCVSINEMNRLSETLEIKTKFNYHIFYNALVNSKKSKKEFLNLFEEYLHRLNIIGLEPYLKQLKSIGYSTNKHDLGLKYLANAKRNSVKFVTKISVLIGK